MYASARKIRYNAREMQFILFLSDASCNFQFTYLDIMRLNLLTRSNACANKYRQYKSCRIHSCRRRRDVLKQRDVIGALLEARVREKPKLQKRFMIIRTVFIV